MKKHLITAALLFLSVTMMAQTKIVVLDIIDVDKDVPDKFEKELHSTIVESINRTTGYEVVNFDYNSICGTEYMTKGFVPYSSIAEIGQRSETEYVALVEASAIHSGRFFVKAVLRNTKNNLSFITVHETIDDNATSMLNCCRSLVAKMLPEAVTTTSEQKNEIIEKANGLNLKLVWIESGNFRMGNNTSLAESDEQSVRTVILDGYYMGAFEITQRQWEIVMGTTISEQRAKYDGSFVYGVGDNYPMYFVSHDEAVEFCNRLNEMTGRKFSLPTEAQWEYAAKGGKNDKNDFIYSGSDGCSAVAWFSANSNESTHPVGQKKCNSLGLYDMSGNLWEWCSDWYGEYSADETSVKNPDGPSTGTIKVIRGGSWYHDSSAARVTNRGGGLVGEGKCVIGFRVVMSTK